MTHDEMMKTGTADLFIHISNLQRENALLKSTNESLLNQCSAYDTQCVEYTREIVTLKAELAETKHTKEYWLHEKTMALAKGYEQGRASALKAQEPAAVTVADVTNTGYAYVKVHNKRWGIPAGTKLFTAPQPAGWKPIDTAPKDRSMFLSVTQLDDGSFGCVGISHIAYIHTIDRDGKPLGYAVCGANPLATHWMPLPSAPEAPQAQDKESWEEGLCPYCYQPLKESK